MSIEWHRLVNGRPRLSQLLGSSLALIGHGDVRREIQERLDTTDTASLTFLSGSVGSGKSALVSWLSEIALERVVDVRTCVDFLSLQLTLEPDGRDVGRLINALRAAVEAAEDPVLVYSDIDHDFRESGIERFVAEAITSLNVGNLVLTLTTDVPAAVFPIPATVLTLDRRAADESEIQDFLDRCTTAVAAPREALSPGLRRAVYELSTQTSDFRTVEFVVELLLAAWRNGRDVLRVDDLQTLLHSDAVADRQLPAIRVSDGRMSFHRKDKTELLAEVLHRAFPEPEELAEACADALADFDGAMFLAEVKESYPDALVSLCLTYSPVELVTQLLAQPTIRAEIKALSLDRTELLLSPPAKADLLVRGLGFSLIGPPRGLRHLREAVDVAANSLRPVDARFDVVNGAGKQIIQQVEAALTDMVGFWAAFLRGSLAEVVRRYNEQPGNASQLQVRKLGLGDKVALARFLNGLAEQEESAFRLRNLKVPQPISRAMLSACTEFVPIRNYFEHWEGGVSGGTAPGAFHRTALELARSANEVLNAAADGSFPSLIKLSEITFDEYSRRIFRGVDADGQEVRFTLTDEDSARQLLVAAHYYMLPLRRVSVNPHIVPRAGAPAPVFAGRAEAYAKYSTTQQGQSQRLLAMIETSPSSVILDVGCGTGRDALVLARRFPHGRVIGIDVSPDMVERAQRAADDSELANIGFELADLFDYEGGSADVVTSSSVMHWFSDPRKAYQRLFHLVRRGGQIVVHQGGRGTYRGLHECARESVGDLGLQEHFDAWNYPLYYPTAAELNALVADAGFVDVSVSSHEYEEAKTVIRDFAEAGLRPYVDRLPEEKRDGFVRYFLQHAKISYPSLYTHRLYLSARRP